MHVRSCETSSFSYIVQSMDLGAKSMFVASCVERSVTLTSEGARDLAYGVCPCPPSAVKGALTRFPIGLDFHLATTV